MHMCVCVCNTKKEGKKISTYLIMQIEIQFESEFAIFFIQLFLFLCGYTLG